MVRAAVDFVLRQNTHFVELSGGQGKCKVCVRICSGHCREGEVAQSECLSNRLLLSHSLAGWKPETEAPAEFEAL